MGLSFTKRESKLQNEILIYKTGLSDYKWDSRVAIHPLAILKYHTQSRMSIIIYRIAINNYIFHYGSIA